MGKYTVYDEKYDSQLDVMFDKIINIVRKEADVISLILFGGFGKGEGSVEIKNGKMVPFNDFDFYVVTRKGATEELSEHLTKKASNVIGTEGLDFVEHPGEKYDPKRFFHADIRCINIEDLPKLKKTQRTFELKYASRVLWGDKNVLQKIKDIDSKELPLPEGIRPMFNKMGTLILSVDEKKLKGKMEKDDRKIMIFYSMKALMTCAEVLLMMTGKFKPRYMERSVELKRTFKYNFPELVEKIPDLPERVERATQFKLKPEFDKIKNPVELWFEAKDTIEVVFRYVIKKYLSLKNDSPEEIAKAFYSHMPHVYFTPYIAESLESNGFPKSFARLLKPAQYYLNILYSRRLRKVNEPSLKILLNWKDVGLKLAVPVFLFLFSVKRDGIDEELFELSRRYLGKVTKVDDSYEWEELRRRILYLYGLYYLQKII